MAQTNRKPRSSKVTVSIAVNTQEAAAISKAASDLEMSNSGWIAQVVRDALAQGEAHVAYIANHWVKRIDDRTKLPTFEKRETRTSGIIRAHDRDLISDVAKRYDTSAHAFIQACAIIASEHPQSRPLGLPAGAPAAPAASETEGALILLAKTLSAFLIKPDRADDLSAKLRRLIGLADDERLSSAHIMAAAIKATREAAAKPDKRTPERGNVVTLSDAVAQLEPRPKITVKAGRVYDQWQNSASIEVFGSKEGAIQALETLRNCVACHDCVECEGCRNCTRCGKCVDCVGCVACISCRKCVGCKSCEGMRDVQGFDGEAVE